MTTYIILCARGLTKYECPHFQQGEIVCAECPYARYKMRKADDKNKSPEENKNND